MGALEDLTAQLDGIAGDTSLSPAEKTASLSSLRERVNDVVGYADRLIIQQHRQREGAAAVGVRDQMLARRRADLHEAALGAGESAAELEESALLSHATLDQLREEGLEGEALERLEGEFPGGSPFTPVPSRKVTRW